MSLLGDGASCSANGNPLRQADKVFSTDRSLQREFAQAAGQPQAFRGARAQMAAPDQQMMQAMQQPNMDAFKLDDLQREVPSFDRGRAWGAEFGPRPMGSSRASPMPSPAIAGPANAWASEFQSRPDLQRRDTSEYIGRVPSEPRMFNRFRSYPMGQMGQMGHVPNQMLGQPGQSSQAQPVQSQKWEEEFERAEKQATPSTETQSAEQTTADQAQADQAQAHQAGVDQANLDRMDQSQGVDVDFHTEDMLHNAHDVRDVNLEDVDNDWALGSFPPNWNEMWDTINRPEDARTGVRAEDFRGTTGQYEFQKDNEYAQEEDPFALGVYMMDNGAKLSSAVLCFEEAVKRDPSHVEAWARLGDAQAQNEIEDMAIVALERAVALNPQHSRALLNLSISYTNEGYDMAASQILEKWFVSRYPDIAELTRSEQLTREAVTLDQVKSRITRMFLRAAQRSAEMDPDVQVGLGVLFYRDEDYNKAVDCFRAALDARPGDASLWNRLGATLANSSQPEEAINSYSTALSLRPSFVRARYNLAVSCINIGCYKEAADHILSAMALHETEEHSLIDFDRSANLLDTLRRVFFAMDRRDLLSKLQPGVSLDAFREEFSF